VLRYTVTFVSVEAVQTSALVIYSTFLFYSYFAPKLVQKCTFVVNEKCESFIVSCKTKYVARNFVTMCGRKCVLLVSRGLTLQNIFLPSFLASIKIFSVDVTDLRNGGGPVNRETVYLTEQLNTLINLL